MAFVVSVGAFQVVAQEKKESERSRLVLNEGVKPHKGVDDIYIRFSKAYDDLNPKGVADLYTSDAAYLSPGSEIRIGRGYILNSFIRSFTSVSDREEKRMIDFRIHQRIIGKELGYDVGEFILTSVAKDGSKRTSRGKFVVVAVEQEYGIWRFQVDGYSNIEERQNN